MPDFTSLGRTDKAGFTHAVRREIVVQHERVFALAPDRIDYLCVTAGTKCRSDNGLRLATGKYCRTMSTCQHADLDFDGTHRGRVTSVDTRLAGNDAISYDALFKLRQSTFDFVFRPACVIAARQ